MSHMSFKAAINKLKSMKTFDYDPSTISEEMVVNAFSDINESGIWQYARRGTAGTSYGMKHVLEQWRKQTKPDANYYVSNDAFCVAMVMAGFAPKKIGVSNPNVHFKNCKCTYQPVNNRLVSIYEG